jgi:hypothetical protein
LKLFAFMTNEALCGREFLAPSWSTWRVIARLIDGDAHLLTGEEQALALKLTGRTKLPTSAPRELYVGAGRRSGKSRFGALVAVWLASQEYPQLAAGEAAVVVDVAPDRRQAEIDLSYSRGLVEGSEALSDELASAPTQDTITFKHRTQLEIATASFRTVRGRTLAGAVVDESAFLRSDESALPDLELARALRPALLTLNGLLLVISSPHRKVGLLHDGYKRYYGNDAESRALYIQATSRELNPLLNEEAVAEAMRDDPAAAHSEYLGEFRADLQSFLDDETVDRAIVPSRRMLPRMSTTEYVAFVDAAAGVIGGDSFALAIAHQETGGRVVLDVARTFAPPFQPSEVIRQCAETLGAYGCTNVTGDAYASNFCSDEFRKCGITYLQSAIPKSQIYLDALPLFTSGVIELLDSPQLRTQLLLLERRPRAGGRDTVDHPKGSHDDLSNACAGVLRLAARLTGADRWGASAPSPALHKSGLDYDPLARYADEVERANSALERRTYGRH